MSKILRITAAVAGFRRAGIAHPALPTEYPVERFSDEQIAALLEEPRLTVEVVEVEDLKPVKNNPAKKSGDEAPGAAAGAAPGSGQTDAEKEAQAAADKAKADADAKAAADKAQADADAKAAADKAKADADAKAAADKAKKTATDKKKGK